MPGGRGGRRQGTPGKGYSNRTDLATNYTGAASDMPPSTPAAPPAGVSQGYEPPPMIYPEDIPKLDDPTGRPHESLTTGLSTSTPGSDPILDDLRTAYMAHPTTQLAAVIRMHEERAGKF